MQYWITTVTVVAVLQTAYACMSGDPSGTGNLPQPIPPVKPVTPAPDSPFAAECKSLGADFGIGDSGAYTLSKFDSLDGSKRFDNKGTGVPHAADGKAKFIGAKLKPGEKATLTSVPVSFSQNQNLLVKYYEATSGIVLKGCSNDESNCQDISNLGIKREDLKWQVGNYPLTVGTNKVILVAENKGTNIGAVGIDQIGISDGPNGVDHCVGSRSLTLYELYELLQKF